MKKLARAQMRAAVAAVVLLVTCAATAQAGPTLKRGAAPLIEAGLEAVQLHWLGDVRICPSTGAVDEVDISIIIERGERTSGPPTGFPPAPPEIRFRKYWRAAIRVTASGVSISETRHPCERPPSTRGSRRARYALQPALAQRGATWPPAALSNGSAGLVGLGVEELQYRWLPTVLKRCGARPPAEAVILRILVRRRDADPLAAWQKLWRGWVRVGSLDDVRVLGSADPCDSLDY